MDLSLPEIELLRAIERSEQSGTAFARLEDVVTFLDDPPLEENAARIRTALKDLRNKGMIKFEVGKGVSVTESGTTALRAV